MQSKGADPHIIIRTYAACLLKFREHLLEDQKGCTERRSECGVQVWIFQGLSRQTDCCLF